MKPINFFIRTDYYKFKEVYEKLKDLNNKKKSKYNELEELIGKFKYKEIIKILDQVSFEEIDVKILYFILLEIKNYITNYNDTNENINVNDNKIDDGNEDSIKTKGDNQINNTFHEDSNISEEEIENLKIKYKKIKKEIFKKLSKKFIKIDLSIFSEDEIYFLKLNYLKSRKNELKRMKINKKFIIELIKRELNMFIFYFDLDIRSFNDEIFRNFVFSCFYDDLKIFNEKDFILNSGDDEFGDVVLKIIKNFVNNKNEQQNECFYL